MSKVFLICVAFLLSSCSRESDPNEQAIFTDRIDKPCSTFVTQYAPTKTPILRENGNESELHISFTPAKSREVDLIISTLKGGKTEFSIKDTDTKIIGLRISENFDFVVKVNSKEHARLVLKDLCFEESKIDI